MLPKLVSLLLVSSLALFASDDKLQFACKAENNATACYLYGLPLVTGDNAKAQDIMEEGLSYMRRACLEGEKRGCDVMGENYYKTKNYKVAMEYLEDGCSRDVRTSCEYMGMIYRDGHDVRPDDTKTRKYFEKACELKSGSACMNIGFMYRGGFGVQKDRQKEKEYYKKGCDAGVEAGCKRYQKMDNEDKGIETGIWATVKGWFK